MLTIQKQEQIAKCGGTSIEGCGEDSARFLFPSF
jgi:hypothetical protein